MSIAFLKAARVFSGASPEKPRWAMTITGNSPIPESPMESSPLLPSSLIVFPVYVPQGITKIPIIFQRVLEKILLAILIHPCLNQRCPRSTTRAGGGKLIIAIDLTGIHSGGWTPIFTLSIQEEVSKLDGGFLGGQRPNERLRISPPVFPFLSFASHFLYVIVFRNCLPFLHREDGFMQNFLISYFAEQKGGMKNERG
jgi:hypothetical protein